MTGARASQRWLGRQTKRASGSGLQAPGSRYSGENGKHLAVHQQPLQPEAWRLKPEALLVRPLKRASCPAKQRKIGPSPRAQISLALGRGLCEKQAWSRVTEHLRTPPGPEGSNGSWSTGCSGPFVAVVGKAVMASRMESRRRVDGVGPAPVGRWCYNVDANASHGQMRKARAGIAWSRIQAIQ